MSDDDTAARDEHSRENRPLSDQERAELYREQLRQLHVIDLVRDMMVTLVTVGYEKLGLTEQTRELRDLGDARVAIESLRRLIEVVEGEGGDEAGSLRSTLAQMQLNFARASAEPRRGAEAPQAQSGPAERAPQEHAAKKPFEADAHPSVEGEEQSAKKPAAKKPATKKLVAKKPATKKPAAKKPAVGKPAKKPPTTTPSAD
jgi:hypothetical protein